MFINKIIRIYQNKNIKYMIKNVMSVEFKDNKKIRIIKINK